MRSAQVSVGVCGVGVVICAVVGTISVYSNMFVVLVPCCTHMSNPTRHIYYLDTQAGSNEKGRVTKRNVRFLCEVKVYSYLDSSDSFGQPYHR